MEWIRPKRFLCRRRWWGITRYQMRCNWLGLGYARSANTVQPHLKIHLYDSQYRRAIGIDYNYKVISRNGLVYLENPIPFYPTAHKFD
jgi:hypothetical protein